MSAPSRKESHEDRSVSRRLTTGTAIGERTGLNRWGDDAGAAPIYCPGPAPDNRSVLLSALYFDQPCSLDDLSEATGLSAASVSNVIRELIEAGIAAEAGSVESDGGRPRIQLRMNADYGYVIGVDVGETRVQVELFDLMMTERAKAGYPLDPRNHGPGVIVAAILAGLDAVLASAGVRPDAVLGVGIGVPGIVAADGPQVLSTCSPSAGTQSRWN